MISLTSKEPKFVIKAASQLKNITDPVVIQRLESTTVAFLAIGLYANLNASWWLFFGLILIPDLSLLSYCKNRCVGSRIYNLTHNYASPLFIGLLMTVPSIPYALEITLIWTAHIAIDRSFGYGLKYPTHFKHTHLSWK